MDMRRYIEKYIEDSYVDMNDFGDIIIYLLHYGVICRPRAGTHSSDDPVIEKTLYDKFVLVKNEIADYLSVIGMGVYHNEEFESIRLYPPDADFPGNHNVVESESASSLLRFNISKEIAASLIILYLLYEQYGAEKEEDFTIAVSQVEFMSAFRSKLNLNIAEKINKTSKAKEELFRELKRLRVIKYHKDFFDNAEQYPIVIRPLILDLVPQSIVKSTLEEFSRQGTSEVVTEDN